MFHSAATMFAPCGFTVVANFPNGNTKGIAVLDDRDHALDYAKGCTSIYNNTVYTVKQNYPDSCYTN